MLESTGGQAGGTKKRKNKEPPEVGGLAGGERAIIYEFIANGGEILKLGEGEGGMLEHHLGRERENGAEVYLSRDPQCKKNKLMILGQQKPEKPPWTEVILWSNENTQQEGGDPHQEQSYRTAEREA